MIKISEMMIEITQLKMNDQNCNLKVNAMHHFQHKFLYHFFS